MSDPDLSPRPPGGLRPTPLIIACAISLATAGGIGGLQLAGQGDRVPSILGTISSWVSAGGIMGILSLLVWLQMGNRKLRLEERQAENKDEADLRDHYAEELATMRERFDAAQARNAQTVIEVESKYRKLLLETEEHYKRLLADSDRAHEECKRDRDALREELASLRDEIAGLRRQIITQSTNRVLALGEPGNEPSEAVHGAARRVSKRLGRGADRPRES